MPKTIMCVDDEVNALKLYQRELRDEGYAVAAASTAADALRQITERPLDLVVLDIRLSDCDGLELLDEIRKARRDLPILIYSAYSSYKYDFHCWLADDYLVKSADLSELKLRIKKLLRI